MKRFNCFVWMIVIWPFLLTGQRIRPGDLEYLGAFRLPEGPDEIGWGYSGQGLTYYPNGDPTGPEDGFAGSLFGIGHDWNTYVSEVSIPVPVISLNKNVDELNTAVTLQPFQNIRPAYFEDVYLEQTRTGLAYLPAQGKQSSGKLYYCFAAHMGETETRPTHGWCDLDLSNPQSAGPWRLGEYWNYVTADYVFEISESWAELYTPGLRLAAGRFRDGGQGSQGPTMFAYGPWNHGNPPEQGSTISCTPLLLYGDVYIEGNPTMNGYHHSDAWDGGAWLTAGDRSAVIFTGTKGQGRCWYGLIDGTVWEEPYPNDKPDYLLETRGWWSERFEGQMIFYDTDDLAAVARGTLESWEPQPYDSLNLDPCLYHIESERQKSHVMACAFDRERGYLYVMEPEADDDKSLIHVWRVQGEETNVHRSPSTVQGFQLLQAYPNPCNRSMVIRYRLNGIASVQLKILDNRGRLCNTLFNGCQYPGDHIFSWNATDAYGKWLPSGLYIIYLRAGHFYQVKKFILLN
ncbi:hypothetical protein JW835_06105 [bacterium]|nr:hypothetical protein [bacterium]